ncbi:MAG: elongation factor Ts [Minisyncoccia bacterium]
MNITIEQTKELRDKTGISVMQCKKALEDAGGDMEKAVILLRKKGADIASKKAGREFHSGRVATYVHGTGTAGAMVEISCESDFVAKNEEFSKMAYDIAMQIVATKPNYIKREDVPSDEMEKAKEVFSAEVKGKPADIQEKILAGKLDSYFKDKVLLEQDFIKDPNMTVAILLQNAIQKFGEKMEIARFTRYGVMEK